MLQLLAMTGGMVEVLIDAMIDAIIERGAVTDTEIVRADTRITHQIVLIAIDVTGTAKPGIHTDQRDIEISLHFVSLSPVYNHSNRTEFRYPLATNTIT